MVNYKIFHPSTDNSFKNLKDVKHVAISSEPLQIPDPHSHHYKYIGNRQLYNDIHYYTIAEGINFFNIFSLERDMTQKATLPQAHCIQSKDAFDLRPWSNNNREEDKRQASVLTVTRSYR